MSGLRRDLGLVESYAALIGMLIGAGIFKVTGDAWRHTGPSVILGYVVLAPAILSTSVAYAVFLSTPLGQEPGGAYTHIARTFGRRSIAFVGVWLKIIAYVGALAYLAAAFAEHLILLSGGLLDLARHRLPLALVSLALFYVVHLFGVRWFGRAQVAMCVILGLSIVVLIVPGLAAVRLDNYRPFFTGGLRGFAASLPPLFFAYAGFEALAQTAGEVKDSTRRLPSVFLRGVAATVVIYTLMSIVAFGVLPGHRLATTSTPMAEAASVYLPAAGAWFVTLGAVMALATSLNATMLVPSRLGIMLARDDLAPVWMKKVHPRTGTPIHGLTLTLAAAVALLATGQLGLALNIAVLALVVLYFLHSLALLLLPRLNPELHSSVTTGIPHWVRAVSALVSLAALGGLIVVQVVQDLGTMAEKGLRERLAEGALTSIELGLVWTLVGALVYRWARRRGTRATT